MTNPFEAYAETAIVSPVKARHRAEDRRAEKQARAPMKLSPVEQKLADQAKLLSHYRRWRREVQASIVKEHGKEVLALVRILRTLKPATTWDMVEHVKKAKWLLTADDDTKYATLSYIDSALVRCNIRDGRSPFDDPLPGEPDGPFQVLWKLLIEEIENATKRNTVVSRGGRVSRRHDRAEPTQLRPDLERPLGEIRDEQEPEFNFGKGRSTEEGGKPRRSAKEQISKRGEAHLETAPTQGSSVRGAKGRVHR